MACGPREGLTLGPENLGRNQGRAWTWREGSHSTHSCYWNTRITDQINKSFVFCVLQNNTWGLRRRNRPSKSSKIELNTEPGVYCRMCTKLLIIFLLRQTNAAILPICKANRRKGSTCHRALASLSTKWDHCTGFVLETSRMVRWWALPRLIPSYGN